MTAYRFAMLEETAEARVHLAQPPAPSSLQIRQLTTPVEPCRTRVKLEGVTGFMVEPLKGTNERGSVEGTSSLCCNGDLM